MFKWEGWYAWDKLGEVKKELNRTGSYLIAHATSQPTGPAVPSHKDIVYIGETHREKRSLWVRLAEFGTSAGFNGTPANGHSGGWRWPQAASVDSCTGPEHCWVAFCPTPEDLSRAVRSVYPVAAEGSALLEFANAHGDLPKLNRRELPGPGLGKPQPVFSAVQTVALLDRDHEAAKALIDAICTAWNDQTSSDTPLRSYRQGSWRWEGYEREVEGQWWLGVGWSELKGTTVADIWVSKPGTGSFWQKARTPEQLSRLMEQLADWWWWQ